MRTINGTLRDGPHVFGPGSEDELAAYLTPEQGARLLKSGAISGAWDFASQENREAASIIPGAAAPEAKRDRLADKPTAAAKKGK